MQSYQVHRLSKELAKNISVSDFDDITNVSAIANAVKGLNLTDRLNEKLQISSSKRKDVVRLTFGNFDIHPILLLPSQKVC